MVTVGKLGVRHVQAVLLSGGLFANYMQLGNIGIAVVVLTQKEEGDELRRIFDADSIDEKVSVVTGSFFYAQMFFSIIGGFLCTKINNKVLILTASMTGFMSSYLTPLLVYIFDWKAFFFLRLIQGASQGLVDPVVFNLAARWLPTEEMLLLGPGITCGVYSGICFMMMMGGYLGAGQGGWPSIFYFSGNCGLIWCIAYYGLGFTSPDKCFYISDTEKNYINKHVPRSVLEPKRYNIPWKKIFTNISLWAVLVCQIASNWAFHIFVKIWPIYLQQKLHYGLHETGLICGTPFLCMSITVYGTLTFFQYLWKLGKLNHIAVRHLCNAVATFGTAYCFMLCSSSESVYMILFFHHIAFILSSYQLFGFYMSYYDLSPAYIGLTYGLCNGVAHVGSILGPYLTLNMFQNYGYDMEAWTADRDFKSWRKGYDYMGLNYFIAGTLFMFLAEVRDQDFDKNEEKKPITNYKTV